jgi:putative ABC transport system permease protein
MLDALARDTRHAVRGLAARPAYAAVVILTLALLGGAGSAVFAVVNAAFLRPLPFPDGERLVRLYTQPPGTTEARQRNPLHALELARFRAGKLNHADAVEAFLGRARAIGDEAHEAEVIPTAQASAGALTLLGERPILGRTWTEAEDRAIARVAVISHALWQRRFAGEAAILGRKITIDREPHEIIGVMGRDFRPDYVLAADLWTPLGIHEGNLPNPRSTFLLTVARLRPGSGLRELDAEVRAALAAAAMDSPNTHKGWSGGAVDMRELQFGRGRPALMVLLAAVGVLALVAVANLANVILSQVMNRRSELALRAALGGSFRDAIQLQVIECLILAAAGIVGSLALAAWTVPVIVALDPAVEKLLGEAPPTDWRVMAAALGLCTAVAVGAGIIPLARELRRDAARGLTPGGQRTICGRRDAAMARWLLACQTALTLLLLVAGSVLLGGFARAAALNPGFDPSRLIGAQVRVSPTAYPTDVERSVYMGRLLERVRAVPGIVNAATSLNLFIPGFTIQTVVHIEGRPTPDGQPHTVLFRRISPQYFKTMRIRHLAGRDFSDDDRKDRPGVCIVSQSFAKRFWPDVDPIGRRLQRADALLTVVGVVDEVFDLGLGQAPDPTLYVPYAQNNPSAITVTLVARAGGDPTTLAKDVRAAVLEVDRGQPLDQVVLLEQFMTDSLGPHRFRSTVLLVLAGLGLTIAGVGIYGLTSRSVTERRREVGIRLALGAQPSDVWRMVVVESLRPVGIGLIAGVAASAVAARALMGVLPDLERADPRAVAAAAALLTLTAFAATVWPAGRAVRVDPVTTLRAE